MTTFLQVKDGVLLNTDVIARIERSGPDNTDTQVIDVRGKVSLVAAPLSVVTRALTGQGCRVIDVGSTESDFQRAREKKAGTP